MNPPVYIDLLRDSVERHHDKPCLSIKRGDTWQTWTFGDFRRDLNRLASALAARGIARGVNAAIIGPNAPEWVIAHQAIICAGGCTVPIDPNLPREEIGEIIRLTEVRAVFCAPVFAPLFRDLQTQHAHIALIVSLDPSDAAGCVAWNALLDEGSDARDALSGSFAPDDPLSIIFTSGTTGKARGSVLVQRNLTAVSLHGAPRMRILPDDVMIAVLPLHHVFGCAGCVVATLCIGLRTVFVPEMKGPLILEALREQRITILTAVPQLLELLYANIERAVRSRGPAVRAVFGLLAILSAVLGPLLGQEFRRRLFSSVHAGFGGRLRLIISGGSSLKKTEFTGFRRMGFDIVEGYGLTETFGPITLCPRGDPRRGSVGPVLEDNEMRIDAPNESGIGEVCFRGATVFAGYHRKAEATRAVFDAQGWFHTGDLGRLSHDGFLYLTGRSKDVIVLDSGKNVYPDELEEFYGVSALIEEIGVIGVAGSGREIVGAVIVPSKELRKKYPLDAIRGLLRDELRRLDRHLPSYKKISTFMISTQPLPRTSTRKIIKPDLRRIYGALRKDAAATRRELRISYIENADAQSEEFTRIAALIAHLSQSVPLQAATPRSNLEFDCGIDSLKRIELICEIEESFGIVIPPEHQQKMETIGDAVACVRDLLKSGKPAVAAPTRRLTEQSSKQTIRPRGGILYRYVPNAGMRIGRWLWRARVAGAENLGTDQPLIIAANHESLLDIAFVIGALPWPVRRRTFTIGKKELARTPVLGPFLLRCNMIPVERMGDVAEAMALSLAVIRAGCCFVIFPEGTRTRTGAMGPFKSGVGALMLQTNAAAVPVRIRNTFDIWPAGKLPRMAPKDREPTVTFGRPVTVRELQDQRLIGDNPTAQETADAVRGIIKGM
jgi:long-chain acyl-CoA synthetase